MEKDGGREFVAQVEANLTLLLQAMEGISKRLDERKVPPDQGERIGELAKTATALIERVKRVEASEALKSTSKAHAETMDKAAARVAAQGRENVKAALRTLIAATDIINEARKHVRHPYDQKVRNWQFLAGGVLISAVLWFLATASVLPPAYSIWPYRMMNSATLWGVGWDFLGRANENSRDRIIRADFIYRDNFDAFAACADAARRRGTSVECRIVVPVPK